MTDDVGQAALRQTAAALTDHLGGCESALRPLGDTEHMQHREFAWRAKLLGIYIGAALRAADAAAYPASFALLRTALEHRIFDRLLFLGTLHRSVIEDVTDEMWARWQAEPPGHLERWERAADGKVTAVWRGPRVVDDDDDEDLYGLSIYYRWWHGFDPFTVRPRHFDLIATGHPVEREQSDAWHRAQEEVWNRALSWRSLKASVQLNSLATEREVAGLDVHYRFLSAFVHPVSKEVTDSVYARQRMGDWPTPDHYSHELVLLYSCWLAIDEIRDFERMTEREPRAGLSGMEVVLRDLDRAEALIEHLWAPGRAPYSYDRAVELNQRVFDTYTAQRRAGVPTTVKRPEQPVLVPDGAVRYYSDPMHRLVQLHRGFSEATSGVVWRSPWQRDDAWRR